jgi:hypothetical protein
MASVYGQKIVRDGLYLSGRIQYDQKHESKHARLGIPAASILTESWGNERFMSVFRGTFAGLGPFGRWTLTPGFSFQTRTWYSDQGPVTYVDYVPHVLWSIPGFGSGEPYDTWTFEYDITFHRQSGPDTLRSRPGSDLIFEHRLDISYDFNFSTDATFRLMATFDMGHLFKGKPWGGGNGQIRISF